MKNRHQNNLVSTAGRLGLIMACFSIQVASSQVGFQPASLLQANGTTDSEGDFNPSLSSDGANTIVATWHSRENVNGAGNDFDILSATSLDGGNQWTQPVLVNANGTSDSQNDLRPEISTNGSGVWMIAWESTDSSGGVGNDSDVFVARSLDNGATWGSAVTVNNAVGDSGADMNPKLTTDKAGVWMIVWDSTESVAGANGDQNIMMSRSLDEGLSWTSPVVLTEPFEGGSFLPDVGTDDQGAWLVAYSIQGDTSNVEVIHSLDQGMSWSQPVKLHQVEAEEGQDFGIRIESGSGGTWIASWESGHSLQATLGSDQDILFSRSRDRGQSWSNPAALNRNASQDGEATDREVKVASTGPGKWVATWTSDSTLSGMIGEDGDILTAVSNDDGMSWSAPVPVAGYSQIDNEDDFSPAIVVPVAGEWLTLWSSARNLSGARGDYDLVGVRTKSPAIWSDARQLSTEPSLENSSNRQPSLVSDGNGTLVTIWSSNDPLEDGIGSDPDILFTRSDDNGLTWTSPAALHANASFDVGDDVWPALAVSETGTWIAAWASSDSLGSALGADQDILFVVSSDGGNTWSGPSALNTNASADSGSDFAPHLASDGKGRWIAVWESTENIGSMIGEDSDVLHAVSLDDGVTWSAPAPVSNLATSDSGEDFVPVVSSDKDGRWLVAWMSNDDQGGTVGSDDDIIFVISDNTGATWSDAKPLNSNAAIDDGEDDDYDPSITNDGKGNWLAFWHSESTLGGSIGTDQDILFSRSTNNGEAWSAPLPVGDYAVSDSGEDINVQVQTDGDEWIAVWESSGKGFAGASASEVLFIRSGDAGATWSSPTPLAGDASITDRFNGSPSIAAGAAGSWTAAWMTRETSPGAGFEIQVAGSTIPSRTGGMLVEAGPDVSILEGTVLFLSAARFSSSSPPHSAQISWGDGTQTSASVDEITGRIGGSHLFRNEGDYTATVSASNSEGQIVSDTFLVVVRNAAPDVDAGGDRVGLPGRRVEFNDVIIIDSGYDDTHTAEVDWGDGETSAATIDPVARRVSASHVYRSDGPFLVTVTVRDNAGAVGSDTFGVNLPLRITSFKPTAGGGAFFAEWQGGMPPYRFVRRNTPDGNWVEVIATNQSSALIPKTSSEGIFRVESNERNAADYELEVTAAATRAPGSEFATITATISVTETSGGTPADPPPLSVFATFGIDSAETAEVTRTDVGKYTAVCRTSIAGNAEVVAGIEEAGVEASVGIVIPPGTVESLDPVIGELAFPDGKSPLVVTVAALDGLGNVAGNGFSNFTVTSDLPFTIAYNECHEAEISFTSEQPGKFPVTISETSSGLSESIELVFPVIGVRSALDCPVMESGAGENVRLTIPLELYIPEGWNFRNVAISLRADSGMTAIAGLSEVRDDDPGDGINLEGAEGFTEGGESFVTLQLSSNGENRPGVARFMLDFDTEGGVGGTGRSEVKGNLDVTGVESDAPHPLFDNTSIPINDEFPPLGGTYICSTKDYYRGCVIYVRTTPRKNKALTDAQICASHNRLNQTFQQGCIYFDKVIAPFTAVGKPVERDIKINTKTKTGKGIRNTKRACAYIRQALKQFKTPPAVSGQTCIVVGIMNGNLKPKGVSIHAAPTEACAPVDGSTLLTPQAFSNTRSLAHEIGHHLDPHRNHNDGKGRKNKNNLMRPSDGGANGTGTFLKDSQIARMRNSKWVTKVNRKVYYCIARY